MSDERYFSFKKVQIEKLKKLFIGTWKYTPLSKEPSPNISAGTFVLLKKAPRVNPFLKRLLKSRV